MARFPSAKALGYFHWPNGEADACPAINHCATVVCPLSEFDAGTLIEMNESRKPQIYRELIDELVQVCKAGQGQIGPRCVRAGIWNKNATKDHIPDQHAMNLLLERMPPADREVLARVLAQEVVTGAFETLKLLEAFQIKPFEDGYEGSAYNDFIGRLADWKWPEA